MSTDQDLQKEERELKPRCQFTDKCDWPFLLEVSEHLASRNFDFEETVSAILGMALKVAGGDRSFLLIEDKDVFTVVTGRDKRHKEIRDRGSSVIPEVLNQVQKERKLYFSPDIRRENFNFSEGRTKIKVKGVLCLPLRLRIRDSGGTGKELRRIVGASVHKLVGMIYVESLGSNMAITPDKETVLSTVSHIATTALLNARLYRSAVSDSLTGTWGRRQFERFLDDELVAFREHRRPFSVVLVDIDGFRHINEKWGMTVGDLLLQRMSEEMKEVLRKGDILGRYGGDEFALILPDTDSCGALAVAEKVKSCLHKKLLSQADVIPVISIGIAVCPEHGNSRDFLVRRADFALVAGKKEGGGKILAFSESFLHLKERTDKLAGILTGDMARDYRNVLVLLETLAEASATRDMNSLLPRILDRMVEVTGAARGFMYFYEHEILKLKVGRNHDRETVEDAECNLELANDVGENGISRLENWIDTATGHEHSIVGVAMVMQEEILGVVYLDALRSVHQFAESDLSFIETLCRQVSFAVENARLFEQGEKQTKQLTESYERIEKLNSRLEERLIYQQDEMDRMRHQLQEAPETVQLKYNYDCIVGKSPAMTKVFKLLDKVTDSRVPVLIQGESGTGKELVARAIHYNGPLVHKPFVSENCAAVTETLLESELFGYMKGAFTGAEKNKKGLFEVADGGTLFLDEVGDMSFGMQKKLLRALQEGEIRPVGGKEVIKVNVRVIAATNKDLKRAMERNEFREDLYYRLNVVSIWMPHLRDRGDDIILLIDFFLNKFCRERNIQSKEISDHALGLLRQYPWPGNVRELENEIKRMVALGDRVIVPEVLSINIRNFKKE